MVVGHDTKGEKEVLKPKSKNGVFLNNTYVGRLGFHRNPTHILLFKGITE